jgi:hypothetical protein
MTIHLIKLSVGPDSLAELVQWQTERLKEQKRKGQTQELIHITRHMPKRAEELLGGGSIYWVIKGMVCGRQRLLELRPLMRDGVPQCGLVYDKEMVLVNPRPHRPFQGWRYLQAGDAPADIVKGTIQEDMPETMRRELALLGLI